MANSVTDTALMAICASIEASAYNPNQAMERANEMQDDHVKTYTKALRGIRLYLAGRKPVSFPLTASFALSHRSKNIVGMKKPANTLAHF